MCTVGAVTVESRMEIPGKGRGIRVLAERWKEVAGFGRAVGSETEGWRNELT